MLHIKKKKKSDQTSNITYHLQKHQQPHSLCDLFAIHCAAPYRSAEEHCYKTPWRRVKQVTAELQISVCVSCLALSTADLLAPFVTVQRCQHGIHQLVTSLQKMRDSKNEKPV